MSASTPSMKRMQKSRVGRFVSIFSMSQQKRRKSRSRGSFFVIETPISLRRLRPKRTKKRRLIFFSGQQNRRYVVAASATDRKTTTSATKPLYWGGARGSSGSRTKQFQDRNRAEASLRGKSGVISIRRPSAASRGSSVETDAISDTLLVRCPARRRMNCRLKRDYAPNATVSIYLVKRGATSNCRKSVCWSEIEGAPAGFAN